MYARFDNQKATLGWGEGNEKIEGLQYLAEVKDCEEKMGLSLSTRFGSLLGDLGYVMNIFEEGHISGDFDILFDRAEGRE